MGLISEDFKAILLIIVLEGDVMYTSLFAGNYAKNDRNYVKNNIYIYFLNNIYKHQNSVKKECNNKAKKQIL